MTRKQQIVVLVGLLISAVFLVLAFRKLDVQAALESLRSANIWLVLAAAAWFVFTRIVVSLRWQFLLRGIKFIGLRELFQLTCIGYMGNNVYPLRAGEILRIYLLQRNDRIPFAQGTVITFAERTFDGIVLLTFVVVSLALLQMPDESLRAITTIAAPVFVFALLVFITLAARPAWFRSLAGLIAGKLPAPFRDLTMRLVDQILASLQGLRTPSLLAGAVLFSYLAWALEATVYWMVAVAMGIETGYVSMLLVVGVVNLAGLIPASPGQLGVFEFFTTAVLTSLGVQPDLALTYALVVHVVVWLPATVIGFFFLVKQGLSWRSISQARDLETLEEKAAPS